MADDAVALEDEGANASRLPEVNIRSNSGQVVSSWVKQGQQPQSLAEARPENHIIPANPSGLDVHEHLAGLGGVDGGIHGLQVVVGRDDERRVGEGSLDRLVGAFAVELALELLGREPVAVGREQGGGGWTHFEGGEEQRDDLRVTNRE
jgi:hypothetical protein